MAETKREATEDVTALRRLLQAKFGPGQRKAFRIETGGTGDHWIEVIARTESGEMVYGWGADPEAAFAAVVRRHES